MENKKIKLSDVIIWFFQGAFVGFGAIMPGISGGTLCVAFGMYQPLISVISKPKGNIKKYGKMLAIFLLGSAFGFVGLSGLAGWLMGISTNLVVCAFIGFILGTLPELWQESGLQGRSKTSYAAGGLGFVVLFILLLLLKTNSSVALKAGTLGFLLCGIMWGLSFIVPGLSSSTLIIFFGLYKPMLDGIASFNLGVILPLAVGTGVCVLLLSKAVNALYEKYYSIISHAILGVILATTVMIIPKPQANLISVSAQLVCIIAGGIIAYYLTKLCNKYKDKTNSQS